MDACQRVTTVFVRIGSLQARIHLFQWWPNGVLEIYGNFEMNFHIIGHGWKKLSYLFQFCKGPAKDTIEDCWIMEAHQVYRRARETLHSVYGKPHIISRATFQHSSTGHSSNHAQCPACPEAAVSHSVLVNSDELETDNAERGTGTRHVQPSPSNRCKLPSHLNNYDLS